MKKTAPAHLSKEAKATWKKLTQEYGIDDAGGLAILKTGLEAFDTAQAARLIIKREGLMIKDRFGTSKMHPLLPVERDARSQWLAALKQLCLDVEPIKAIGRPPEK